MSGSESTTSLQGEAPVGLRKSLGHLQHLALCIGFMTPAATVFIYVPILFMIGGGFSFIALLIAFACHIPLTFCYAELGSAYPLAGGEYSVVSRTIHKGYGFVLIVLQMFMLVVTASVCAMGAGLAAQVIWPGVSAHWVAVAAITFGLVIGFFDIKESVKVSVTLIVLDVVAVAVVIVLGLMHASDPARLVSTTVYDMAGSAGPLTRQTAFAAISFAFIIFMGYQVALVFSEESKDARRRVGRTVLTTLVTIGILLLASTAALFLGTPSLQTLLTSPTPVSDFVTSLGGSTLNKLTQLIVFVVTFEMMMVFCLYCGRMLWSTARDHAWPGPISRALATVNPRHRSPWVAVLVFCAAAIPLVWADVSALAGMMSVLTLTVLGSVALAALFIRFRKDAAPDRYKMPLWPLPPLVGLAAVAFVLSQQPTDMLWVAGVAAAAAVVYYLTYLRPRRKTHWVMEDVPDEEPEMLTGTSQIGGLVMSEAHEHDLNG